MLIHNFNPVAINFFIFEIHWYSLAYIFGILISWIYARSIIKKIRLNNDNLSFINIKNLDDLIPYIIFGIIIGGRLGYVFLYNIGYYTNNLIKIFFIWEGGMSFHGGLVGVIISIIIFCKKKKINSYYYFDIISIVAPIGLFLGRLANFINGELYGKETTVPWGVIFPKLDNLTRHPSQIYESLLEGLILFLLLNFFAFRKKLIFSTGSISGLFLILYSILRIFSEYFREPDTQIGYIFLNFTMGQFLSLLMFIFGIIIFIKKK